MHKKATYKEEKKKVRLYVTGLLLATPCPLCESPRMWTADAE